MINQEMSGLISVLEKELNLKIPPPLKVIIAQSPEQFQAIQTGKVPEWAVATANPEQGVIYLKPYPGGGYSELIHICKHELVHIYLYHRLLGHRAPRWFEEGMAEMFSAGFSLERIWALAGAGLGREFIPFSELERNFPASPSRARLAYYQSEDFVGFLSELLGTDGFQSLLERLSRGEDFYQALFSLTGKDFSQLEKSWQKRVKYHYGFVLIFSGSGSLWFLVSLLFILAYLKKRRQAELKKQLLELEDKFYKIQEGKRWD